MCEHDEKRPFLACATCDKALQKRRHRGIPVGELRVVNEDDKWDARELSGQWAEQSGQVRHDRVDNRVDLIAGFRRFASVSVHK